MKSNKKIKIVANYLPQYHRIPENDNWWGDGFTDWEAVKKSKPLFDGHMQPEEPLDGYYDLSKKDSIVHQVSIANEYGIYGFAIYHYWFSSNLKLLERPAEIILENKDIKTNYFFIWDNQSWKRTWSNVKDGIDWAPNFDQKKVTSSPGMLAELLYGGEEEWRKHFEYLLPFFKDSRYIKENGKPLFGFFNSCVRDDRETLLNMCECWDRWAKENGLNGVICLGKDIRKKNTFDRKFLYSPFTTNNVVVAALFRVVDYLKSKKNKVKVYSYTGIWLETLINAICSARGTILSGFVSYDDTPRRGEKGRIIIGSTPKLFKRYMEMLLKISLRKGSEIVLLTAWNEWGEGAHLEPDSKNKYSYLEVIRDLVKKYN